MSSLFFTRGKIFLFKAIVFWEYKTRSYLLYYTSFFNTIKERNLFQCSMLDYQPPDNMENDFKIKYVVPFINAAFNINDNINLYW
jgi:hypothetical protein